MQIFLFYMLLVGSAIAKDEASEREKRQLPGLGGLGSFGAIPGLGSLSGLGGGGTGSGISSIPGLSKPTVVQPAAGQPCPVALVPQQFGGGLKFGNPFNIGLDIKGQDAKNGAWGTGFDTNFGEEIGGSIFGDAGHAAVPLECKEPQGSAGGAAGGTSQGQQGATVTGGGSSAGGGGFPVSGNNPIAKVLAENPDLLRKALEQNPDLLKGVANRQQVESALTNDPELIRQALLENPALIQGALSQFGGGGNPAPRPSESAGPPPPPADPALKNAVIRKLVKDSTIMRKFVEEHGYSIRLGLKQNGVSRTFSDNELMKLMASNPAILDQIFLVKPGLVAETASKYRIAENWDALPTTENWGGPQAAVYDAFSKDPFFMEDVLINEPLYLKASMRKGKFDTGDLTDDQVRQVLYDHPEYVRAMLSRDSVFTKHIQKKYGVVAGKEYTRKEPSRSEVAFEYLRRNENLMERVFLENPTDIENAVKKQRVDPAKVTMENIIDSYKRRPEMLKLMLLQNPEFVTKVWSKYRELDARGEITNNDGASSGFLLASNGGGFETATPRVKIRTGVINTQVLRESVKPADGAVKIQG